LINGVPTSLLQDSQIKVFQEASMFIKTTIQEKKMKQIKTIVTTIIFLSLSLNVYGLLSFNGGCKAFPDQCEDGGDGASTQTLILGQLIPTAGGYFLQSNSDYQFVLKRIELNETGVIDSIGQTIQNMSYANALYFDIWETSKSLEYDPVVIEKLYHFDYTGYQVENNLNPVIFQQVENFLKQGNVKELFQKAFEDSSKILEKLKEIQTNLEAGIKVDISNYWRLNQLYLEFALLGQYASEVFIMME
jgi:hypothetical protein